MKNDFFMNFEKNKFNKKVDEHKFNMIRIVINDITY
jgi:hypothetical protein